jgi:nucleotide-binding universal stress UspA family protein
MKPIRTILVPMDFSDDSDEALAWGIDLAQRFGAKLHLLHSYLIELGGFSPYDATFPQDLADRVREMATVKLEDRRTRARQAGIEATTHLVPQFPPEAIADAATRIGADLIVMGTRGLTGFKHVLLGSVAERTVRVAPCPVLTVKAKAKGEAAGGA